MTYDAFLEQMKKDLEFDFATELPAKYSGVQIGIRDVEKLQGESYRGISFKNGNSPVEGNLNMKLAYEAHEGGRSFADILHETEQAIMQQVDRMPQFDLGVMSDYQAMKPKLMTELIPQKGNEEKLADVPHEKIEDLALIYRLDLGERNGGRMTSIVTNQMMEQYGITQEQLHQDAVENAAITHPASLRSMREVMAAMMGMEPDPPMPGEPELIVATTQDAYMGASVIQYPGFMDMAAEKIGGDFFMLPSSIHEEFLLSKRQYWQYTGREQKGDVIAYQIRQSFKPGEVTAEEANRIGRELALAFTKGRHAFIVATHTDRAHVHNHIIFNSTSLDCRRKFRNYKRSGIALQHISDRICLEHGLSVIEPKPYAERVKRTDYPKRPKLRDGICGVMDEILNRKPKDFDQFLSMLEAVGYEIKRGKQISVRGKGQKRFIRLRSLGEGYTEEDIRSIIAGKAPHREKKKSTQVHEKPHFNLLIDMQERMQGKGVAYQRWAKVYNLKQISETFLFMREQHIESFEDLYARTDEAVRHFNELNEAIKTAEGKMAANLALQKHIQNYAKTREIYDAYRKTGYSKKFFEEHRAEITLHKAAKDAFNESSFKKLPTIRELRQEYAELLTGKKQAYSGYREAKKRMQDFLKARQNVETFYGDELKKEREEAKEKKNRDI